MRAATGLAASIEAIIEVALSRLLSKMQEKAAGGQKLAYRAKRFL
jgi:hypothetical protein